MSFPPRTWAANDVPTGTLFNEEIGQNFLAIRHAKSLQSEEITVNNSTTFEDLTGLKFAVRSGETWLFWATIFFVTDATADVKFTVTAPPGSTGRFGILHNGTTNTSWATVFGDPISSAIVGTLQECCRIVGLVTAGDDGSVQLRGSQATATAVNTVFHADGSILVVRMV